MASKREALEALNRERQETVKTEVKSEDEIRRIEKKQSDPAKE